MTVDKIIVGQLGVNCYLVCAGDASETAVIDPGDESERISELLDQRGLVPKYIFLTHAHYDHVCASGELKGRYGAAMLMHEAERETYGLTRTLCLSWGFEEEDFPAPDMLVKDGDEIILGDASFKVIHTPGHTPGSICLCTQGLLFTGDTLFKMSVGRTDLTGGNAAKLADSLKRLGALPAETRVCPGHGDETTMGEELMKNPFLSGSRLRFKK